MQEQRWALLLAQISEARVLVQTTEAALRGGRGSTADALSAREALAQLPVTRKHELVALQRRGREQRSEPFGGFSSAAFGPGMPRVFASPGPLYEPEGHSKDHWRVARYAVPVSSRRSPRPMPSASPRWAWYRRAWRWSRTG